jgi:glutamate/tyrosine decarboxylase-like PLP-dependent enzyme
MPGHPKTVAFQPLHVMSPVLPAGFAGSRSGALIATAWASMVHLGEAGFLDITKRIMQVRHRLWVS